MRYFVSLPDGNEQAFPRSSQTFTATRAGIPFALRTVAESAGAAYTGRAMSDRPVVFVIPPQQRRSRKGYLPSLGIGYVATAVARVAPVRLLDAHLYGWGVGDTVERVLSLDPLAVGLTSTTNDRFRAIAVAEGVKQGAGVPVFVGGPHFSLTAADALQHVPAIDYVIVGEGEETAPGLAEAIRTGKPRAGLPGVAYRDESGSAVVPDGCFPGSVDACDLDWGHFDLGAYNARLEGLGRGRAVGVISSRGCPNSCAFCINNAFRGRALRLRDPRLVVDEIEHLRRGYGFRHFDVWDDTFTLSGGHVTAVCEELLRRRLRIRWYARARVNTVDRGMLRLMSRAGCRAIGYGVESGSERVLRQIGKNITLAQVRGAVRETVRCGMGVKAFFMFSHPTETEDDVRTTLDLMEEMRAIKGVRTERAFSLIYPGTELEALARESGQLEAFSWNTYSEDEVAAELGGNPTVPIFRTDTCPLERIRKMVAERER